MVIKILGSGCSKCSKLTENTKEAIAKLGVDAEIVKVEDFKEIMKYGVMATPAMVVDEKLMFYGKVMKTEEIMNLLK